MKLIVKRALLLNLILIVMIALPACKSSLSVQLYDIWGVAIKVMGEEKSNFSAYVNIVNDTPELEGKIVEWDFKVYSGDSLLLEINNNNYKSLGYDTEVMLPAPNYYSGGNLSLMLGIPFYKSRTEFVDLDIFLGKKPDKFDFTCTIRDIDGNTVSLSNANTPIEYLEYDPNQG